MERVGEDYSNLAFPNATIRILHTIIYKLLFLNLKRQYLSSRRINANALSVAILIHTAAFLICWWVFYSKQSSILSNYITDLRAKGLYMMKGLEGLKERRKKKGGGAEGRRKFRLSLVLLHNVLLVFGNEFFSILQHNQLACITIWEK